MFVAPWLSFSAEQGARVAGCDLYDAGGKEMLAVVEAEGAEGFHMHADVSKEEGIKAFVDATAETFDRIYALNLRGAFLCMKYEVSAMRKSGGVAIVNQASIAGHRTGAPDVGLYTATKGGLIGLTRSAALQVAKENISTNAIGFAAWTSQTTCISSGSRRTMSRPKRVPLKFQLEDLDVPRRWWPPSCTCHRTRPGSARVLR